MLKRTIAMLLLVSLLAAAGCGDGASDKDTDSDKMTTDSVDVTTVPEYEYPEADYGGYEFVFLNVEPQNWASSTIAPEEITGDLVNDAMYERNARIGERYNITISEYKESMGGVASLLRRTVSADDDAYDACMLPVHDSSGIINDGIILDLNTISSLNLDKPWWDQMVNEALNIDGKLYMTASDISFFPFEATWAIFFNEEIMEDLGLDMPYDLVREGKWTIDKLKEYAEAGAVLNSDEKFEPYNMQGSCRYGFISHHDFPLGLVIGSGNSFMEIENGEPVFTADSDRMFSVYDKIVALTSETGAYYNWDYNLKTTIDSEFMKERTMMCSETLGFLSKFRSMEANFGVLPMPKYDENQDSYHSIIASWGTTMTTVPVTASDSERTGVILDALAYYSYKNLMEPYYNTYLMQKGARNDESAEMLSIIRDSRIITADFALGWSSGIMDLIRSQLSKGNSSIASSIESKKQAVIEKANKMLE